MANFDEFLEATTKPKKPLTFPLSRHYSEGVKYARLGLQEKALRHFNSALQINPQSFNILLKRGKCFLSMRDYKMAQLDANEALKLNPKCIDLIDLKGQSEYLMGDFEGGYLTYQKGLEIEPNSRMLRIGRELCKKAIINAKPETQTKISGQDILDLKKIRDSKFIPRTRNKIPFLEDFSADKDILNKLLSDPAAKNFHSICKEAISIISDSQRFWAMQMPQRKKCKSDGLPKRINRKTFDFQRIINLISKCKLFLKRDLLKSCIIECQKVIKHIESCTEIQIHSRAKLKANVLHVLSVAYKQDQNNYLALQCLKEELNVSSEYDWFLGEIRALNHLIDYYLKCSYYSKVYFYFITEREKLNSDSFQFFLENMNTYFEEGFICKEDVKEISGAVDWVHDYEKKLRSSMQKSIVDQVLNIVDETRPNEIELSDMEKNSENSFSLNSDTDDTELYFTVEECSNSVTT